MSTTDIAQVQRRLHDAASIGGLLGDATAYHLASGGKAWRAHLAIACGQALGVQHQHTIGLAAACEFVHQASIVHDDVQDQAPLRRGRASVAAKFGAAAALCAGDHLLVGAFAELAALPAGPALARLFATCVSQMAAAQAEEFNPTLWSTMTWSRYEVLAAGKAGAVVALPLAGAALLAGLPAPDIERLSHAADILGTTYQAGDDIEDLTGDLAAASLNGVIARGLDTAGAAQRKRLLDLLAKAQRHPVPKAEAMRASAGLQRAAAITLDWALARLPSAAAALRACTSPGGQSLIPVIERAAQSLAENLARHGESKHAA